MSYSSKQQEQSEQLSVDESNRRRRQRLDLCQAGCRAVWGGAGVQAVMEALAAQACCHKQQLPGPSSAH